MDTTPILTATWPDDLDPADIPFTKRTATILQRQSIYTNPTLLNELTKSDVLGWWNAGPATVEDLRVSGNDAIKRHHTETGLLATLAADLADMASEPWAPHIWYHDPRFAPFVPKGDLTVYEIATAGSAVDRRFLWGHATDLRNGVLARCLFGGEGDPVAFRGRGDLRRRVGSSAIRSGFPLPSSNRVRRILR